MGRRELAIVAASIFSLAVAPGAHGQNGQPLPARIVSAGLTEAELDDLRRAHRQAVRSYEAERAARLQLISENQQLRTYIDSIEPLIVGARALVGMGSEARESLREEICDLVLSEDPVAREALRLIESGRVDEGLRALEARATSLAQAAEASGDANARIRAAQAWGQVGELLAVRDTARGIEAYRQALRLNPVASMAGAHLSLLLTRADRFDEAQSVAASALQNATSRRERQLALLALGDVSFKRGELEAHQRHAQERLAGAREFAAAEPGAEAQRELSSALDMAAIAAIMGARGEFSAEGLRYAEEALSIDRARLAEAPEDHDRMLFAAIGWSRVADLRRQDSRRDAAVQAEQAQNEATALFRRLVSTRPNMVDYRFRLAADLTTRGQLEQRRGRWPQAIAYLEEAEGLLLRVIAQDDQHAEARNWLAITQLELANALFNGGQYEDGLAKALEAQRTNSALLNERGADDALRARSELLRSNIETMREYLRRRR